jgi:hypothetical protein
VRFEPELRALRDRLTLPYPERSTFVAEVGADMEQTYQRLVTEGHDAASAKRQAIADLAMSEEDLTELAAIYTPRAARAVARLPHRARRMIEDFGGVVPLLAFTLFMVGEVSMIGFLHEAGVMSVFIILALGGLGLGVQLQRVFRWFVLRDHSERSLSGLTAGPLYLGAACFLSGVLSMAFGYRNVLAAWSTGAVPEADLLLGMGEPLAALILATAVTGVIVLVHGWLAAWRQRVLVHG